MTKTSLCALAQKIGALLAVLFIALTVLHFAVANASAEYDYSNQIYTAIMKTSPSSGWSMTTKEVREIERRFEAHYDLTILIHIDPSPSSCVSRSGCVNRAGTAVYIYKQGGGCLVAFCTTN